MAKKTIKPTKSMEEALWEAGDHFDKRRQEIMDEYGNESFLDIVDFYAAKNVFYLAPESRWSFIMQNAKQPNIALLIDTALTLVEKHNKPLRGALPNNYYSSLGIDTTKLASLLDEINKI